MLAKIAVTVWQKALPGKCVLSRGRAKGKVVLPDCFCRRGRQMSNRMISESILTVETCSRLGIEHLSTASDIFLFADR